MKGQKSPEIALGDPHGATKVVSDEFAGDDPSPDAPRRDAKHFRGLRDGEKLDRRVPIMATKGFQARRFCAAARPSLRGHLPGFREWALASCLATNPLMLTTVILRERPSL